METTTTPTDTRRPVATTTGHPAWDGDGPGGARGRSGRLPDVLVEGPAAACDLLVELIDTLREIDQVIVTPTDSMALLDLARHHRHVHQLLRDGFGHRTDALIGLRRLTAPQSFTPGLTVPIDYHHARAVLEHTLALLDHAGRALTRADSLLVGELTAAIQTPTAPQPRPRKRS